MSSENFAVRMRGITKTFANVVANEDVDLDLERGEIHALLGENGAGKSTLMNVLTGLYRQDVGEIEIYGSPVELKSPTQALRLGIGMVHQHFKLIQSFTVAQNIHLGWDETPLFVNDDELNRRTAELSKQFGLDVQPDAVVRDLSAGAQQRVEILRVLARGAKILILDEPTAVLTSIETRKLFDALRDMRKSGKTIVFISHKLEEVLEISDRTTTLRNGKVVKTQLTKDTDSLKLANLMVGHEIVFERIARPEAPPIGDKPVLELKNIDVRAANGVKSLSNINLTIGRQEILGIAGIAGNGQRQLSEVIAGITKIEAGNILLNGAEISHLGAGEVAELGVGHIPEDRLKSGLAGTLPVYTNSVLRIFTKSPVAHGMWYRDAAARGFANQMVETAQVKPANVQAELRNLSGGNQQRLIAQRECELANDLLIAVYPMRGLDLGAVESLREIIMSRRNSGAAVLLVSEELTELLEVADRIAVMHRGAIVGTVNATDTNPGELGRMMGGQKLTEGESDADAMEA